MRPLPVEPPVAPMLAKLARELPHDEHGFEPKWDGFRCLVFRNGEAIDLRSRHDKPMARYFPDAVDALRAVDEPRVVLDGEIVVTTDRGFDFDALLKRIHPAAKHIDRLVATSSACFIAFDVLAIHERDVRDEPFAARRARLESIDGVRMSPLTWDAAEAGAWLADLPPGTDGVIAKHRDLRYRPGARAMTKVKTLRTAECVVAGFRPTAALDGVSSLLLGLYDGEVLRHVGVVSSFTRARRAELLDDLRPHVITLDDHPWRDGFALEGGSLGRLPGSAGRWTPSMELDRVPLRPELVCEAGYDQVDGCRWRHPGRFLRWRPDRDPRSCRSTARRTTTR